MGDDSKQQGRQGPEGPDVFAYLDYRAFLRDHYEQRKATVGLSYRGFSRRAKLRSPNYLKLVIDGDRNLTPAMSRRFTCGASTAACSSWRAAASTACRPRTATSPRCLAAGAGRQEQGGDSFWLDLSH